MNIASAINEDLKRKVRVKYFLRDPIRMDAIFTVDGKAVRIPIYDFYMVKTNSGDYIPLFYFDDKRVKVKLDWNGKTRVIPVGLNSIDEIPNDIKNLIRNHTISVNFNVFTTDIMDSYTIFKVMRFVKETAPMESHKVDKEVYTKIPELIGVYDVETIFSNYNTYTALFRLKETKEPEIILITDDKVIYGDHTFVNAYEREGEILIHIIDTMLNYTLGNKMKVLYDDGVYLYSPGLNFKKLVEDSEDVYVFINPKSGVVAVYVDGAVFVTTYNELFEEFLINSQFKYSTKNCDVKYYNFHNKNLVILSTDKPITKSLIRETINNIYEVSILHTFGGKVFHSISKGIYNVKKKFNFTSNGHFA